MSDGQTLTLGTNFQADVKNFTEGVKQVRELLASLRKEVEGVSKTVAALNSAAGTQGIKNLTASVSKASSQARTFYGDMSELQKALGRTENLSGKYSATLSNLTKGMDKNSLSIKDAEKAMYATDKVLRGLTRSYTNNLSQTALSAKNWGVVVDRYRAFQKAADLGTISQKVFNGELKATDASVKEHIQSVTNGRVTFDKFTESKKKAWPIINQVNKAIDSGTLSWQEAAKQQAAYQAVTQKTTTTTSTLSQKFKEVTGNAKGMNTVWRTMNKAVDDGTMSWQEMSRVQAKWQADNSNASSKARETTKVIKEQAGETSLLTKAMQSLGGSLKTIASYGAASAVLYGITSALRSGVAEIIDYDQALKNLQAISGATSAELEIMDGVMQEVARRTKFSTVEIGQAMVLLGQSGFSAAESVSSINAVAMLATGTLSDMTNTADLLTTTIRAYGLEAIEANRVSDVMANAINKSKLTLDKLRIAFNYVGATSSQAGLTLEETAASLMMLANNGLRASTMGTGLRQILAKMVAPTAKVKDVLASVGMSIDSINPGVVGFQQALMNLRTVMVDSKGIVDMSKAFEMFGLRGAQAAAVLIRSLGPTGGFHDAIDSVYEVGTAAHMASIQQEGLAIKIKNMADRAKSLAIAIGNAGLAGAIGLFIDAIRGALSLVLEFTDTMGGKFLLNITVVTGLIYGLIKALKLLGVQNAITSFATLASNGGLLAAAMGKLRLVITALTSPILLVATAIAGVGIAISYLVKRIDNAIIKHQKLQAEHKASSDSLELYAEAIAKTDGAGRDYESMIERLKEEHPDLKKVVDENAFSHIALANAMKEVAKQKTDAAFMEQINALEMLQKKMEQQKDAYSDVAFFAQGDNSEQAMKNFIENSEKGRKTFADFDDEIKKFTASLFNLYGAEGIETANERLVSMLNMSDLSPEHAQRIYDKSIDQYKEFIERHKRITESAAIEHVDMTAKAGEILGLSRHVMAEQYEIEKEAIEKKLSALQMAYDQEVRLAELAAVEKKRSTQEIMEQELTYRGDSMGRYAELEKNAQQQLITFRQQGSDRAVEIVRDETGKIIAAHDGYTQAMLRQEQAYQQRMQAIESTNSTDLYQQLFERRFALVEGFYQRQIQETDRAYEIEKSIVLARFENENAATRDLEKLDKDYHTRRINLRKEELSMLEGMLKDEVARYEEAQNRIISLRQELVGLEKSREDALSAIRRKNLSDYQKYKEDEANFAKLMAQAVKEAELAAMAESDVERDRRLEKAKELYKEAADMAEELNREVKEGENIVVTAKDAEKKAIEAVTKAYDGQEAVVKKQQKIAEAQSATALLNQAKIKEELVRVQNELEELVKKDWIANLKIKMDGVKEVDDLIRKLKDLDGKTTHHTVNVTTVEKTVKQSRWGGFVDGIKKFANGGPLSGYGGGDIVDAKLEPGEYVLRKEAVRNVGVGVLNAMNNLKLGAAEILSSIKAKTGGYLMPQVQMSVQLPRLAYQTGGTVQRENIPNFGSLNLSIDNREVGKIYAAPDVLNILSKQVQLKNRLRNNR